MANDEEKCTNESLMQKIAELSKQLEKANIAEYIEYHRRPGRVIYISFLSGMARGFGIAIGASVLAAIFLYLMSLLIKLNLPVLSRFIAEMVDLVTKQLGTLRTLR